MKELDDFTVERLQSFINQPLDNGFTRNEQMALARIALAAKTAEPVAWWTGPEPTLTGELESIHDHETGGHYLPLISISTTSEAALSRETFIFKVANFLCTRRQSIAREVETASMIYDMVNTQVTERQKASIRDGISELRSHIESLGGFNHDAVSAERAAPPLNSPAIPDGCQWTYDDHDYKWDSACGDAWQFTDGGPEDNHVKFCQGCGKPVLLPPTTEK